MYVCTYVSPVPIRTVEPPYKGQVGDVSLCCLLLGGNKCTITMGSLSFVQRLSSFQKVTIKQATSFFFSLSHTTRAQRSKESHGRDYLFIDNATFSKAVKMVLILFLINPSPGVDFSRGRVVTSACHYLLCLWLQGEFVQTVNTGNGGYGLSITMVEQVAQMGLACVTHMSLEVHR